MSITTMSPGKQSHSSSRCSMKKYLWFAMKPASSYFRVSSHSFLSQWAPPLPLMNSKTSKRFSLILSSFISLRILAPLQCSPHLLSSYWETHLTILGPGWRKSSKTRCVKRAGEVADLHSCSGKWQALPPTWPESDDLPDEINCPLEAILIRQWL